MKILMVVGVILLYAAWAYFWAKYEDKIADWILRYKKRNDTEEKP